VVAEAGTVAVGMVEDGMAEAGTAAGVTVAMAGGITVDGSLITGGGEATGCHPGGAAAGREDIAFVPTRPA
jgi:hypothetical protein